MDLFLIKNHFSVLFLTHSFPLISSSPFFFLTLHVPFHLIALTLSLVMIVGSSVFLLSLTFCCLHSIDCTCYVPCDDHQSTYFLYLPINTYLLFSWWHPVHWPFVVTCVFASFMYLHIDTYLSFLSPQVMSCYLGCYFSHANQRPFTPMSSVLSPVVGDIFIHSLTLKCPFSELKQRPFTPMSSVLSAVVGHIFIHSLTLKCPFSELKQRPFTPMSSVLPAVVGHIFIHSLTLKCPFSELNQRPFTPMSSVLPAVVGHIFIHSLTLKCPFSELSQWSFTL